MANELLGELGYKFYYNRIRFICGLFNKGMKSKRQLVYPRRRTALTSRAVESLVANALWVVTRPVAAAHERAGRADADIIQGPALGQGTRQNFLEPAEASVPVVEQDEQWSIYVTAFVWG